MDLDLQIFGNIPSIRISGSIHKRILPNSLSYISLLPLLIPLPLNLDFVFVNTTDPPTF